MGMLLRVLIADDHTLVRESLVSLLQAGGDVQVVAQASNGVETVEKAIATRPDVVVTDLSMPGLGGIEVTAEIVEPLPPLDSDLQTLLFRVAQEALTNVARHSGARTALIRLVARDGTLRLQVADDGRGCDPGAAEQMQNPDRTVDDPYGRLTAREREVFHLVVEGLTTKEIARRLDISVKTAENHRARVIAKVGVRNTAELVRYALRRGLLD